MCVYEGKEEQDEKKREGGGGTGTHYGPGFFNILTAMTDKCVCQKYFPVHHTTRIHMVSVFSLKTSFCYETELVDSLFSHI